MKWYSVLIIMFFLKLHSFLPLHVELEVKRALFTTDAISFPVHNKLKEHV